jgi:hypothetical protein
MPTHTIREVIEPDRTTVNGSFEDAPQAKVIQFHTEGSTVPEKDSAKVHEPRNSVIGKS